eukprot:GHRQ01017369.1.p1 GENE.GHRQ01017369.1~~GHRQ01017369.1.p1  ORF type:complete len:244 (+),score=37.36 GHRQ01017369.1:746-1477(+)
MQKYAQLSRAAVHTPTAQQLRMLCMSSMYTWDLQRRQAPARRSADTVMFPAIYDWLYIEKPQHRKANPCGGCWVRRQAKVRITSAQLKVQQLTAARRGEKQHNITQGQNMTDAATTTAQILLNTAKQLDNCVTHKRSRTHPFPATGNSNRQQQQHPASRNYDYGKGSALHIYNLLSCSPLSCTRCNSGHCEHTHCVAPAIVLSGPIGSEAPLAIHQKLHPIAARTQHQCSLKPAVAKKSGAAL